MAALRTVVELKRRHDLIPNLVATGQGYASHESTTLKAVTNARALAISAGANADPTKVAAAETGLSSTLRSLFAVAENYPALRAEDSNRLIDTHPPLAERILALERTAQGRSV